jgi:hypothetical protein
MNLEYVVQPLGCREMSKQAKACTTYGSWSQGAPILASGLSMNLCRVGRRCRTAPISGRHRPGTVTRWLSHCVSALILILASLTLSGQHFRLEEYTIGRNPGRSQGGELSLTSTLGQPVVGIAASDIYILVSGFWGSNEIFSQPEMPALTITASPGLTTLSWNASINGLQLQESTSLEAPVWSDVRQMPVYLGPTAQVILRSSGAQRFYRLRWPSL